MRKNSTARTKRKKRTRTRTANDGDFVVPYADTNVRSKLVRRFFNPYFQLGIDAMLVSAAELLLKKGAIAGTHLQSGVAWLGVGALTSGWTWIGILAYVLSFACWLYVLRCIPVSVAFGLVSIAQVLVPLGAWAFLGEAITMQRWIGIVSVLCGTALIARMIIAKEVSP